MSSEGFSASALIFYFLLQTAINLQVLSLSTDSAGGKWTAMHTNPSPSERKNAAIILITPPSHLLSSLYTAVPVPWLVSTGRDLSDASLVPCYLLAGLRQVRMLWLAAQGWRENCCYPSLKAASIGLRSSGSHGIFSSFSLYFFFSTTLKKNNP